MGLAGTSGGPAPDSGHFPPPGDRTGAAADGGTNEAAAREGFPGGGELHPSSRRQRTVTLSLSTVSAWSPAPWTIWNS